MTPDTPWLLVPVRSLAQGKRRLAGRLDARERAALNTQFLDHLLAQAAHWPGLEHTVVVSPCTDVLARARAAGARALRQPALPHLDEASSQALNAALTIARQTLRRWGARSLLVASCDLPGLRARDLRALADCGRCGPGAPRVALATDRAGRGTNALYLPAGTALPFCFGAHSARRHADAARQRGLALARADIAGLAFDIDTPDDLALWLQPEQACA
ncbi:MAG: 2-phospho-L-lactate guanylyltransferase [Burkholderiaceae bacterium]|nr:2-phospho-L-lactate guanylyltransferase [Burkholderiaceae bacterium]